MQNINLAGMSAESLQDLAKKALSLAKDLQQKQPSYDLALENGIEDCSYSTVRWGMISSYRGECVIEMADGSKWRAIGHKPCGNAHVVSKHGWIEFIPLTEENNHE